MDQLKKNGFWVGIGASGVVLLGLWAWKVMPLSGLQSREAGTLKTLVKDLQPAERPSDDAIQKWKALRAKMIESYTKITGFYAASDQHLERWFPGLPENPPPGAFLAEYRKNAEQIEQQVKAKGTLIGLDDGAGQVKYGFNWEDLTPAIWGVIPAEDQAKVLKDLQKRYWARERVAKAILKPDVKVTRVHDFRFFKPLHTRIQQPAWEVPPTGAEDQVQYPGTRVEAGQVARNFQEYVLPNELGQTITFGFAVVLPFGEVPKVLKEILNPELEPRDETGKGRLLVNLIGAEVSLREQNEPLIVMTWTEGDKAQEQAERAKAEAKVGVKDVMLAVTCQIIDFEPSKIAKLSEEPPAPVEAAPQN